MKYFLLTALLNCFVFFTPLSAQVYDHIVAAGFNTIGFELEPLENGRWLAVGVGEKLPGGSYTDSVVAVVFDANGTIVHRHILPLHHAEVHEVVTATGTSGGGYAIAVAHNLCDASTGAGTLLVFDKDSQLLWSKHNSFGQPNTPQFLTGTPDGNLLSVEPGKFVKYDLQTGVALFEAPMLTSPNTFVRIYDLTYHPGTEDLVGVGIPSLQYWKKTGTPDVPAYQLSSAVIDPFSSVSRLTQSPAGQYYTFDFYKGIVYEFAPPNLSHSLIGDYPFSITDLAATDQELILFANLNAVPSLVRTDFAGVIQETQVVSDQWQSAGYLSLQGNMLALSGSSGSGTAITNQPWLPFNSSQFWLQTRPLPLSNQNEAHPNVSLNAISQGATVQVISFNSSNGKRYNFKGGQFSVQVSNAGSKTVNSIDVLIGFDWVEDFICYIRPAERRHFPGLSLAPGESVWLDFGDVSAIGQSTAPTQFCFWTARPNEKPDANHDDDTFCHTVLVNAVEPEMPGLALSPNPASAGFWITTPQNIPPCNLFDYTGRLIQTSRIPAGETQFFIPTADLPDGIYFLQAGSFVEKIVVRHDR